MTDLKMAERELENNQPPFWNLLLEAHIGLERQGPGSPDTVKKALAFLAMSCKFD